MKKKTRFWLCIDDPEWSPHTGKARLFVGGRKPIKSGGRFVSSGSLKTFCVDEFKKIFGFRPKVGECIEVLVTVNPLPVE